MSQGFLMSGDLDGLTVDLTVEEKGSKVEYVFDLESDRSTCLVERRVIGENRVALSSETWQRKLEELKDAQTEFAPIVIWVLRGMWGIPLQFGYEPKTGRLPAPLGSD